MPDYSDDGYHYQIMVIAIKDKSSHSYLQHFSIEALKKEKIREKEVYTIPICKKT